MTRWHATSLVAALLALVPAGATASLAPWSHSPAVRGLRVASGSPHFAGDRRLLATISPNGDGLRDRAIVRFRLDEPATVRIEAVRTDTIRPGRPAESAIWSLEKKLGAGPQHLVWEPAPGTPPRTYILRLTVSDALGRTHVYGDYEPGQRVDAPVVRVLGVDAGFLRRSYRPGQRAAVRVRTDAPSLTAQVFAYSNRFHRREADFKTSGAAMTSQVPIDWRAHRNHPALLEFGRAGEWPSGLYFLRLRAQGELGYAPFVVRPRRLGLHRVAVVLATNTWQAYNFYDANGDGWGDSWYVSGIQRTVDLRRPYLDFGVPFRFRDWDLSFVAWLNRTGKQVDFLSDDDLARVRSGQALAGKYDLVVFPGHEEYVGAHAYDVVRQYRDAGGNLMFLAANNFYWRVDCRSDRCTRIKKWRDLGHPEAALAGVQYVASNHGAHQEPFVVRGAESVPWVFAGTGLRNGDTLGTSYGIEIDARTDASPPGVQLLADIPNLMGNRSAEMTYYETPRGAKVFAAGAINFAASIDDPIVSRVVENVWTRLSQP